MKIFEKLTAVEHGEALVRELETVETPQAFQELLQKHGVVLTMDEIREMAEAIAARKNSELSESDLENVAGGGLLDDLGQAIYDWMEKKFVDWIVNPIKKYWGLG